MKILFSLQFLVFLVAPLAYRSVRPSMMVFYHRMSHTLGMRKTYGMMLMMFLITFHFYWLQLTGNHYEVLLSSALCFMLFSYRFAEWMFRYFQDRFRFCIFGLATLALCFAPHMFPMAVTLATFLFGIVFFPSRFAKNARWPMLPFQYFRWDVLEGYRPSEPRVKRKDTGNKGAAPTASKGCAKPSSPHFADEVETEDAEVLEYIENDALSCHTPPAEPEVDGLPPLPKSRDEGTQKPALLVCGKPNTPVLALPNREDSSERSKLHEFNPAER